ncbi:MAG: alpha-1,4-glucan--maltose-1-phosphate maltosyltransferase [Vulcanimicrobiaceae bacterium]
MGLRAYNLFPTLAGPIASWTPHLARAGRMHFDWLYVNPIHRTGGSSSLYAVADYYRLNPVLRDGDRRSDGAIVASLVESAQRFDLAVMLDLVINHTASDAPLVHDRPDWYVRDVAGAVVAPSALDPDTGEVTVWGDLAELDYRPRPQREAMVAFFEDVVRHYVRLGVRGFRCDAAYKVPGDVWARIISAARDVNAGVVFAAETLGCSPSQVAQLAPAGFDYLFNSSKWWDFRSSWLFAQDRTNRRIAPSIAFPESHDTPRLASDLVGRTAAEIEAEYRFRYLFAATFSSGVMMPMGYEFGFSRALDVVRTSPGDWERPRFDLQAFVGEVNAMKAAVPALDARGVEALALASDARGIGLLRASDDGAHVALAVVNSDRRATIDIDARTLVAALAGTPRDVTPRLAAKPAVRDGDSIALHPLEIRVFARDAIAQLPDPAAYATHPARAARAVSIEAIDPQIDGGRHAVKCIVGDAVVVEADVFRDGHDEIAVRLLWRAAGSLAWHEAPMQPVGNDRFRGTLTVDTIGRHEYTIEAWPDAFATWRRDVGKKLAAGQDVARELAEGRALLHAAAGRSDATQGDAFTRAIRDIDALESDASRALLLRGDVLAELVASAPDRSAATRYAPALPLDVDRVAGRFSAWYEFFPRSAGAPGVHGTFADAARRLPAIAAMGFDIVYLPPIHPIGRAFRKGPNNSLDAGPDDPGSPWAIGNADGGHTAVEPALGTLSDFDGFVAAARDVGLEVALDYALQCSPDHPFVREHPEWFAFRPDGTIKYAENPPKKYQDIVNFDWYGPAAPALWDALRDIVLFWIAHGVRVFRVDNPHTKPFAFWEWMIADVRGRHPETLFLAEAFTRPKVMAELAKVGFSTSYTYFTWRTTKAELTDYVTELTQTELAQYYRPNFWPNTPDILPPYLQDGGMAAFRIRFVLAATLASAYGIYSGYELGEADALAGREEYADSEKYQLRARDFDVPHSIAPDIARVNAIRRAHPALADWRNVRFYRADDDAVIFFGKRRGNDVIFVAVNLDPHRERDALLWFPTGELGLRDDDDYPVGELLGGTTHAWRGSAHRWRLDPKVNPAAIFHVGVPA